MRRLLLTISFFFILSCTKTAENHQEIESLQNRISILEKENKNLKDSLSKSEEAFLYSQILIGIPERHTQKVGKKNKIVMLFQTYDKTLPKYEIYRVEDGKEIKIGENNKTRFDFEFTPKSVEDNSPEIFITFKYNGKILKFPGKLMLDVEK